MVATMGCTSRDQLSKANEYTCPMHPAIVQDKPGTCPICAMDLVRKGRPGEEVMITTELNYLLKPTNAVVISQIKTILPVQKSMNVTASFNGMITYDARRFTTIPIRFGGRVEKLFVKYNFQPIRKGQKILEIYSPELLTAQRDLLFLLNSDKENIQLIEGAKEKLRFLGVSDVQINQLILTKQESYSFAVHSPVDGYVVAETPVPGQAASGQSQNSASMDGGTTNGSTSNGKQMAAPIISKELQIREGMYVSTGQVIFKVVNTEWVWAEFDVYQQDAAFIHINDPVQLTLDNNSIVIEARVHFVQPFFESGESFVKARVYLPNAGSQFRIGQLVKATFVKPEKDSWWIPLSARLNLGTKEIAFIKRRGVFRPKEIVTARQSGDWIEVLKGLDASDSLTYNAQFMIDSESFIKVRN